MANQSSSVGGSSPVVSSSSTGGSSPVTYGFSPIHQTSGSSGSTGSVGGMSPVSQPVAPLPDNFVGPPTQQQMIAKQSQQYSAITPDVQEILKNQGQREYHTSVDGEKSLGGKLPFGYSETEASVINPVSRQAFGVDAYDAYLTGSIPKGSALAGWVEERIGILRGVKPENVKDTVGAGGFSSFASQVQETKRKEDELLSLGYRPVMSLAEGGIRYVKIGGDQQISAHKEVPSTMKSDGFGMAELGLFPYGKTSSVKGGLSEEIRTARTADTVSAKGKNQMLAGVGISYPYGTVKQTKQEIITGKQYESYNESKKEEFTRGYIKTLNPETIADIQKTGNLTMQFKDNMTISIPSKTVKQIYLEEIGAEELAVEGKPVYLKDIPALGMLETEIKKSHLSTDISYSAKADMVTFGTEAAWGVVSSGSDLFSIATIMGGAGAFASGVKGVGISVLKAKTKKESINILGKSVIGVGKAGFELSTAPVYSTVSSMVFTGKKASDILSITSKVERGVNVLSYGAAAVGDKGWLGDIGRARLQVSEDYYKYVTFQEKPSERYGIAIGHSIMNLPYYGLNLQSSGVKTISNKGVLKPESEWGIRLYKGMNVGATIGLTGYSVAYEYGKTKDVGQALARGYGRASQTLGYDYVFEKATVDRAFSQSPYYAKAQVILERNIAKGKIVPSEYVTRVTSIDMPTTSSTGKIGFDSLSFGKVEAKQADARAFAKISAKQDISGFKFDFGKGEFGKPDIGKPDYGKQDIGKIDYGKQDIGKIDYGKPDIGKQDLGRPDIRPDFGRIDLKIDLGKPDYGKTDNKIDIGKPDYGKPDNKIDIRFSHPFVFPIPFGGFGGGGGGGGKYKKGISSAKVQEYRPSLAAVMFGIRGKQAFAGGLGIRPMQDIGIRKRSRYAVLGKKPMKTKSKQIRGKRFKFW